MREVITVGDSDSHREGRAQEEGEGRGETRRGGQGSHQWFLEIETGAQVARLGRVVVEMQRNLV